MLNSIRRRKRTISVGPQSEADARELIANREQARRDNKAAAASLAAASGPLLRVPMANDFAVTPEEPADAPGYLAVKRNEANLSMPLKQLNSAGNELLTPPASDNGNASDSGNDDDKSDRRMFSKLEKPRIRYDVEVITKLVVYAGIAWLAVEGNPLLFNQLGIA